MVQKHFHFVQVFLRHVRLVQLHVQPRHFHHVATVRVLADLVAAGHLRTLRIRKDSLGKSTSLLVTAFLCSTWLRKTSLASPMAPMVLMNPRVFR